MTEVVALFHRHGGRIETITAIEHSTHLGVADWEYRGRVVWDDGTVSEQAHIAPFCLCHDDTAASRERVRELSEKLNAYLERNGKWHDPKHVNGRIVHWTPKKPAGREALT